MKTIFGVALLAGLALFANGASVHAQEVGPNKMPVAEWGDEEYHLEVIPDAKAGTVTVYVYGNHDDLHKAKKKAIETKTITVIFKNPEITLKLEAAPEKDDPKDNDTPCSATGASARACSRTRSGRPPRIMKFSEIASNQSTRAAPACTSGKC